MKYKTILIVLGILFIGTQCDDEVSPCSGGGAINECLTDANGRLYYKSDIKAYVIRYFVPGTIDSFKTGVICKTEVGDIELDKSINADVVFTGCFREDGGDIQPLSFTGGEEFFYLDLENVNIES